MNTKLALAIAAASMVLGGGGIAYAGVEATNEVPRWMTKVCEQEDSNNCQWNAQTEGNGQGASYYVRHFPQSDTTCIMYIDHPRADYCEKN